MTLVLVAHGTRDPAGVALARRLAGTMGARLAFVDVLGPSLREVLAEVAGPVTVIPAFLAAGYHVRVDVPREVAASGRDDVTVTEALGPDSAVVSAVAARLAEAGWRRGDGVVLAAAGSSDPRAVADVDAAAARLSALTGHRVRAGYLATGTPRLPELVDELRAAGRQRVAVGCWLLAPGRFHRAATDSGADVVTEPLGTHPAVLDRLAELAGSHCPGTDPRLELAW